MTKGPATVLLLAAFLAVGVACGPSDEEVQQLGGERNQQQPTQASSTPTVIELGDAEAVDASTEIDGHIPVRPASSEIESYRLYVLDLINEDRANHDAPPVQLGMNEVAQFEAEDSLVQILGDGYLNPIESPYSSEGLKHYMAYTAMGGTGRAIPAGNSAGYSDLSVCREHLGICPPIDIPETIRTTYWPLVYGEVPHPIILQSGVETVHIGLAWDDQQWVFALSLYFEYVGLEYAVEPRFDRGIFRMAARPVDELGIGAIEIYFDPPPRPLTREERDHFLVYCVGGGLTQNCDYVRPVVFMLRSLQAGSGLEPNVTADTWTERTDGTISIRATLGPLVANPGVYTVLIWSADLDIVLSEYSIFAY